MDHMQILKRAWRILWQYRALWVFGVLLALTTPQGGGGGGHSGSSGSGGGGSFYFPPAGSIAKDLNHMFNQLPADPALVLAQTGRAAAALICGLLCLGLVVFIVFTILHFVSQVALIRMVDHYESSGEKVSWRQGFRLGWSRAAWRLLLINLVIYGPLVIVILALVGCAVLPLLAVSQGRHEPPIAAIIFTIGMVFLVIFAIIVAGVAISMVIEIIRRVCVLQDAGIGASLRQGWRLVRNRFSDVFLMWLILIGLHIGFAVALIPVILLLLGIGLLAGGGLGAVLYLLIQAAANTTAGWVAAAVVGGMLFLVILIPPLLFLNGLRMAYFSTVWTLAYRQLIPPTPQPDGAPHPELQEEDELLENAADRPRTS